MTGPLSGLMVVDFTHGVAGPYATTILGDLGCEVIKIEKPGRGDASRYMNVTPNLKGGIPEVGGDYFLSINRNKKAITVDLKNPKGKEIALELTKKADIVVQNFRPGVMTSLGLDYEHIKAVNPKIIYASISAYGQSGSMSDKAGMDVAVQARSGVMSITGYKGSPPVRPGASIADLGTAVYCVTSIVSALFYRERTGVGQEVDTSLLDATMSLLINYSVPVIDGGVDFEPFGSGHPQIVPYQAFPSKDGYIVIAGGTNSLFRRICTTLELEGIADDDRFKSNENRVVNREELIRIISEVTKRKTTDEWLAILESNDIPCAPVKTLKDAFNDSQLAANEMITSVKHPTIGSLKLLGIPFKFSESKCSIHLPPPMMGEHTDAVLSELLGKDKVQLDSLRKEGVI